MLKVNIDAIFLEKYKYMIKNISFMKKKLILPLIILVIFALVLSSCSFTQAESINESNSSSLYVDIITAYYCCLEDDGIENDVYTCIHISFLSPYYTNNLYLYLDLELPSGIYFAYLISMKFYGLYEYTLQVELINHALEAGDYILFAALFFAHPNDPRLATSTLIFDPPGSHDNSGDVPTPDIKVF